MTLRAIQLVSTPCRGIISAERNIRVSIPSQWFLPPVGESSLLRIKAKSWMFLMMFLPPVGESSLLSSSKEEYEAAYAGFYPLSGNHLC